MSIDWETYNEKGEVLTKREGHMCISHVNADTNNRNFHTAKVLPQNMETTYGETREGTIVQHYPYPFRSTYCKILKEASFGEHFQCIKKANDIHVVLPYDMPKGQMLVLTSMVRWLWESGHGNVVEEMVRWYEEGYTADTAIVLGHWSSNKCEWHGFLYQHGCVENLVTEFKQRFDTLKESAHHHMTPSNGGKKFVNFKHPEDLEAFVNCIGGKLRQH